MEKNSERRKKSQERMKTWEPGERKGADRKKRRKRRKKRKERKEEPKREEKESGEKGRTWERKDKDHLENGDGGNIIRNRRKKRWKDGRRRFCIKNKELERQDKIEEEYPGIKKSIRAKSERRKEKEEGEDDREGGEDGRRKREVW